MLTRPSPSAFWRNVLELTSALALLAAWDLLNFARKLEVDLSVSRSWQAMLAALALLALLALSRVAVSFSRTGDRLWARLEAGERVRGATRWIGLPLFLIASVLYSLISLSSISVLLGGVLWVRLLIFWFAALLGMWALKIWRSDVSWFTTLLIALLVQAGVHRVIVDLPVATNYPFSLGWAETTRFYLASLFVSEQLYGQRLAWPIINPSLHILLIPPYWLDAPLWFHRFWQMAMRVGMLGFTSWALITRLALPKRALRSFVWLWAFLFLFQGPLYFPLALSGILVLLGFSAQRPLRTWIAILIASAWCGLSRINWFPVPASLAALLYLLETPYERGSFWRYIVAPILWVIAGTSTALIAQRVYISVSGTESSAFYTSLVSDLLWYRLLPNATYSLGILPGITLVTLPPALVIYFGLRQRFADLGFLRVSFIGLGLLAFFLVGLIVSTKIGGGADLHNMDAYLFMLLIISMYLFFGGYAPQSGPQVVPVSLHWSVLMLLTVIPVFFAAQQFAGFKTYDTSRAQTVIHELQTRVDEANVQGRESLFISQRQLIALGMLKNARLFPPYEREELMEMAMSNQKEYLSAFRTDLEEQRYAFIVVDPLKYKLLGRGDTMGEENNAWVRRVMKPILCNYQLSVSYPEFNLAIYVPQEGERHCP